MNKLVLGLMGITASCACFADETIINTTQPLNTNNIFYVGAGVAAGGFNNQLQLENAGKTITSNKNNGVLGTDLHIGVAHKAVRAELSLGYINTQRAYSEYDSFAKENVIKEANSNALTTMLDGFYDLRVNNQLSAFVGAGVGLMHTFASGTAASKQSQQTSASDNFAYNAKVGLDYDINSNIQAYANGEMLRLTGDNAHMNNKDYFTTFSAGINYFL